MLKIKVAGYVFGLENRYDYVRSACRDYLCDDEPEVVFTLSDDDLAAFDTYSKPENREHYALHGKIANWLLPHDTLLFHGSCLALDGNGILFTAPSGTGKSTHAGLWRERFGVRVTMINDDKPLIEFKPQITGLHGLDKHRFDMAVIENDRGSSIEPTSILEGKTLETRFRDFDSKIEVQPYQINNFREDSCSFVSENKSVKSVKSVVEENSCVVYGSPWCGKEGIHTNTSAPLRCIVVLRQAPENTIRRLTPKEATAHFLHQALIPGDNMAMRLKALDLIGRLAQLPIYELDCTISQEAVDLSYSALTNHRLQDYTDDNR